MVDQALNTVANTMALVQAAESEGFALDEEFTASMQSVLENFETYAVSGGFTKADGQADLGAYLQELPRPRRKYGLVPDIPSQLLPLCGLFRLSVSKARVFRRADRGLL